MELIDYVTLGIGTLLIPLVIFWLNKILPIIDVRLKKAIPQIEKSFNHLFMLAYQCITHGTQFSTKMAAAQAAGAIIFIGAFAAFGLTDLQLAWASLCPLLGRGGCSTEFNFGFEYLLAINTVLPPLIFAMVITDLLAWTRLTPFASIERLRFTTLMAALLCFIASVTVGIGLADYRSEIMTIVETPIPLDEAINSLDDLAKLILLSLAGILLIGIFFTFVAFENFLSLIGFVLAGSAGLGIAGLWIVLNFLDSILEILTTTVKMVLDFIRPAFQTLMTGMQGVARRDDDMLEGNEPSSKDEGVTKKPNPDDDTSPNDDLTQWQEQPSKSPEDRDNGEKEHRLTDNIKEKRTEKVGSTNGKH